MKKINLISLLLCSLFSSCGGSGGGSDLVENEEIASNIIASEQTFGQDGNLYKPRSDEKGAGGGNLVVLLSSKFTAEFDSCEMKKSNGETASLICINDQPWTQFPFSCFSNGGRQTWRADFPCNEAAEVKVVCKDLQQQVTFTVPESARRSVCNRFG